MDTQVLTAREREVAELIAWGASKKEIADKLCISEHTVAQHTRSIFSKTGCGKANELSAWWFCTNYHIPFQMSPLMRKLSALLLLSLIFLRITSTDTQMIRTRTRMTAQTVRVVRLRKTEDNKN